MNLPRRRFTLDVFPNFLAEALDAPDLTLRLNNFRFLFFVSLCGVFLYSRVNGAFPIYDDGRDFRELSWGQQQQQTSNKWSTFTFIIKNLSSSPHAVRIRPRHYWFQLQKYFHDLSVQSVLPLFLKYSSYELREPG